MNPPQAFEVLIYIDRDGRLHYRVDPEVAAWLRIQPSSHLEGGAGLWWMASALADMRKFWRRVWGKS